MEENKEVVEETSENPTEEESSENSEELSEKELAELKKNASASSQNFERAKNAEKEAKELKKELEVLREKSEESEPQKNQETALLEKLERITLRQADITHSDDIELARSTAKKWNMDIDEVIVDEDFKVKLERQQKSRANTEATSGVKGGGGTSGAKEKPEYWIAKGTPPTAKDVPDRKTRVKIARAMMADAKIGKKFYNE